MRPDSLSDMTVRLMNTVRVGLARFVITTMFPLRSRMKRRLVSHGDGVMQTGPLKDNPGNALDKVYPNCGGDAGICSEVFATRWFSPDVCARPSANKISIIITVGRNGMTLIARKMPAIPRQGNQPVFAKLSKL